MFFTEEFLRHFRNPLNVGDIEPADGVGEATSDGCGDILRISISVSGSRIGGAKFRAYGCAAAIAGGSLVTQLARGMSLDQAAAISAEALAAAFGGVPPVKMRCLATVCNALRAAIENSLAKRS